MNKSLNCLKLFLLTVLMMFIAMPAFASTNVISSVIISKAKNKPLGYELNIDSSEIVQYRVDIEDSENIYFDLKNSTLAKNLSTIYDDVSSIENVVVKQVSKNRVRIHVKGQDVDETELIFVNSLFDTSQSSKSIIINRPINEYRPITQEEDLEDLEVEQEWDDNSFNFKHLGATLLASLKNEPQGLGITIGILFLIFAIIIRKLTSKISQEQEPLIGMKVQPQQTPKFTPNTRMQTMNAIKPQPKEIPSVSKRNETLRLAQEELTKAHQKYQEYLQNKYKNNIGKYKMNNPINIDAITKGIALSQYQKSTQNPYMNQEVIKIKKELNNATNYSNGDFKIPSRPKVQPANNFTSPYIKKTPKNDFVEAKNSTPKNMKFLESVSKIYEQSGRSDLANELKNSMSKAKQKI